MCSVKHSMSNGRGGLLHEDLCEGVAKVHWDGSRGYKGGCSYGCARWRLMLNVSCGKMHAGQGPHGSWTGHRRTWDRLAQVMRDCCCPAWVACHAHRAGQAAGGRGRGSDGRGRDSRWLRCRGRAREHRMSRRRGRMCMRWLWRMLWCRLRVSRGSPADRSRHACNGTKTVF